MKVEEESACGLSLKLISTLISLIPLAGPPGLKSRDLLLQVSRETPHLLVDMNLHGTPGLACAHAFFQTSQLHF